MAVLTEGKSMKSNQVSCLGLHGTLPLGGGAAQWRKWAACIRPSFSAGPPPLRFVYKSDAWAPALAAGQHAGRDARDTTTLLITST